jgi:hypothetical protein
MWIRRRDNLRAATPVRQCSGARRAHAPPVPMIGKEMRMTYRMRTIDEFFPLTGPCLDEFKKKLDGIEPGLWRRLDRAAELNPGQGRALLDHLLEYCCRASHTTQIELGRAGLLALPRAWLMERLPAAAEPLLQLDEYWEFLRLMEIVEALDADFLRTIIQRGMRSGDPEVREVAGEWRDVLGG